MSGKFIVDENEIARRAGQEVPLLRVFNLATFGINHDAFINYLRPSFSILPVDPYDSKRAQVEFLKRRFPLKSALLDSFLQRFWAGHEDLESVVDIIVRMTPADIMEFDRIGLTGHRKRSMACFTVYRPSSRHEWKIDRVPGGRFTQKVAPGDSRKFERRFAEMSEFVSEYDGIQQLIRELANIVGRLHSSATVLSLNLHQMFIFADLMSDGENAPEGIHQDGADYIVSALVIERAGITGGESIVYGPDKQTALLRRTLAEGEGILQADKPIWHYVTPIQEDPSEPPDFGHRSIFGVDITVHL